MKANHNCPKCGGTRLLVVRDLVVGAALDPATGEPRATFEAIVCEQCSYAELYSGSPLVVDGDRVRRLEGRDEDTFDDLPEAEGLAEASWAGGDFEITEVSRVEKRASVAPGIVVVLVRVGPRPQAVLAVLRDTLGLGFRSEADLLPSLPLALMELATPLAARGLRKLLEEAGAEIELRPKKE